MPRQDLGSPGGITTPDQRLRVFVSSTLEELADARAAARAAIEQLHLAPVMFESGARPHPARELYRAYLEQSDLFVGIYWQRYGWVGPDMTTSGLEEEFLLSEGLPRLLYLRRPAPDMEPELRAMLDRIRSGGNLSYKSFADVGQLHDLLVDDLATLLSERFGRAAEPRGPAYVIPAPVTPLVGRDRDVSEVADLVVDGHHRLVVLTGTGGIGKTRLALAVVERTRERWPDGAAFVDLTPVADAGAAVELVASALGFVGQGRETPAQTLGRRLADREMLLVLDNFEQVMDAAPVLAGLLNQARGLHLLVTSRVVLRLRGEREFRVEPLSLARDDDEPGTLSAAVRLLAERLRDIRPGFRMTTANEAVLAELCARLDGLPLALELAASWMRLLTPEQVLERLTQRPENGGRLADLPDRQQTMEATLEWSYGLLPPPARRLLGRLSVFAAPFTAEAAEAVGAGDDDDATEALGVLLDHSIISPAERPDGAPAFRLLQVVRRFAAERLQDADPAAGNLAAYLRGVLEKVAPDFGGLDWELRLLDSEEANLAVAMAWAAAGEDPPGELLRLLADVWIWSLVRGNLRASSRLRQRIDAWPARALEDPADRLAWQWLHLLGLQADGQWARAGELAGEILPAARAAGDTQRWRILLIRAIARPYVPGDPAGVELAEAASVAGSAGRPLALLYVQSHLGALHALDGDADRARAMHEEALTAARRLGDENLSAELNYFLAMDALVGGRAGTAYPHLETAARFYTDIDHRDGLTRCLGMLAGVAAERGELRAAARLTGTVAAARESIGLVPWPLVEEVERRIEARIRAGLPDAEFSTQVAAGRAVALEEALAGALRELAPAS